MGRRFEAGTIAPPPKEGSTIFPRTVFHLLTAVQNRFAAFRASKVDTLDMLNQMSLEKKEELKECLKRLEEALSSASSAEYHIIGRAYLHPLLR
jgi:hypothetical protein